MTDTRLILCIAGIIVLSAVVMVGRVHCQRVAAQREAIELQGVGCDLWIIYPVDLEMLDDEGVRV